MSLGPWQVLLIAVVVLVLFGRGKISSLMGEVGKGITSFKRGVQEGKDELEEQIEEEDAVNSIVDQLRFAGDNPAAVLMLDREHAGRPSAGLDG